jgi:uroporphyrin-III C-methyltransferase/precorrin-2 dehydrogenase/sirohydrochlorin ferrochelatase
MFVKLDDRRCLVVGAGSIARPKIESLLRAKASVIVVAPDAHAEIELWGREDRIEWRRREFAPDDLDGSFLVVAATNRKAVNHSVAEAARERGVLCNSVDDPPDCDFYYPSVVERGDLQVAVSTAGRSPALAMQLREELSAMLPENTGAWLNALGEQRMRVLAVLPPGADRTKLLHQLARRETCDPRECPVEQTLERILERKADWRDSTTGQAGVAHAGTVYLAGAGPGAPDLLTLRTRALLETATCILHDDLVSPAIVATARADALIVNVGKRCGQKLVTQEQIHAWMIEYAREGRSVVRLKGGDPGLFGRAAEEISALTEAGIAFEIVPGISAPLAAAAAARISLTDRDRNSRVVFTTRHRADSDKAPLPDATPSSPDSAACDAGTTLAFYMPGKNYAALQEELLAKGWPSETTCIVVSGASLPSQQIATTRLGELVALVPLPAPSIILVLPKPAA